MAGNTCTEYKLKGNKRKKEILLPDPALILTDFPLKQLQFFRLPDMLYTISLMTIIKTHCPLKNLSLQNY